MTEIFVLIILAGVILAVASLNLWLSYKAPRKEYTPLFEGMQNALVNLDKSLAGVESLIKDEFARNREEFNKNSRQAREESGAALKSFENSVLNRMAEIANLQKNQLDTFTSQLVTLTKSNEDKLDKMTQTIELRLEKMRETIEGKLKSIQEDNHEKLERIRLTVDEKLHNTLEQRLGESFKIVSERLELVHKGFGEMQALATGVGDLKKVLSNVKTRGVLGEIQLDNILDQLLTPDQYGKNVCTKKGSRDFVEFAIKLPSKDDSGQVVYLPLDAKFPLENYHALVDAYEQGNPAAVEEAARLLENTIKKCAKDVRDKYIDPPYTTDFGILFLPVEGLYAEVVRRAGLIETLQREYKITIAGPTTLSAFLNSLHMGFRTLAIEKRSSEVWQVLGAVKTEFEKFGGVLDRAQEKLHQASGEIDTLVGARTRQIQRKLKNIQCLSAQDAAVYLPEETLDNDGDKSGGGAPV